MNLERARLFHSWELTPKEAIALQKELREAVSLQDRLPTEVRTLGGLDLGFENGGETTRAATVVLDASTLKVLDYAIIRQPTVWPYIPGLLSFREIPAGLVALSKLKVTPELLLCDGQGIAHPRRLGIASHLGLLLDMPTIGVAKSLYVGKHGEVPEKKGSHVPLIDKGETVGVALRSRDRVKPIFVSPGHHICLESAIHWVLRALTKYRLPETTRQADHLASHDEKPLS